MKVRIIKQLPFDAVLHEVRTFYRVYFSKSRKSRVYWVWLDGTIESF